MQARLLTSQMYFLRYRHTHRGALQIASWRYNGFFVDRQHTDILSDGRHADLLADRHHTSLLASRRYNGLLVDRWYTDLLVSCSWRYIGPLTGRQYNALLLRLLLRQRPLDGDWGIKA